LIDPLNLFHCAMSIMCGGVLKSSAVQDITQICLVFYLVRHLITYLDN